jgi:hypothetical protein
VENSNLGGKLEVGHLEKFIWVCTVSFFVFFF